MKERNEWYVFVDFILFCFFFVFFLSIFVFSLHLSIIYCSRPLSVYSDSFHNSIKSWFHEESLNKLFLIFFNSLRRHHQLFWFFLSWVLIFFSLSFLCLRHFFLIFLFLLFCSLLFTFFFHFSLSSVLFIRWGCLCVSNYTILCHNSFVCFVSFFTLFHFFGFSS